MEYTVNSELICERQIQGDPRGGYKIGHLEPVSSCERVSNSKCYRDKAVGMYEYKSLVNGNKEVESTDLILF